MQRVTAVILLSYFLYIGFVLVSGVDYEGWRALFEQTWMRVFSMLALFSLVVHAWIGLWVVFTDYLTPRMLGSAGNVLRLAAQAVCGIIVFAYLIWGIQIFWGF
jgi:succinate dehydrogenase / fumarate reductase membrane anchor subunit